MGVLMIHSRIGKLGFAILYLGITINDGSKSKRSMLK